MKSKACFAALGWMLVNCGEADHLRTESEVSVSSDRYVEVPLKGETPLLDRSQCGATADFQDVELYDGTYGVSPGFAEAHRNPVGYHVEPGCSGTLIANNVFVSAGHCGYQVGDTVRFGYQRALDGTVQGGEDFRVVEVLEQQNTSTLDYAVVRLEGTPGARYGFARIGDREATNGEWLTIIGHPARRPKQISTGPKIAEASSVGSNWFRHQADTLGGSSGSGVIGADGRLVGVHTNAGCSTSGAIHGNSAIRMTVLLDNSAALSDVVSFYPPAALQNAGGLCLDVHAPDIANNGGRVQVWACNGQPQQQWSVKDGAVVDAAGLCLDVHSPDIANNGGRVQVWECNGQPQQQWRIENGVLVNAAGLCLDVHAPDIANNGGRVQVWACNGQPQQTWSLSAAPVIDGAGLCLDVHAPDIANNGGRVQVWTCNGQPQQQWHFEGGAILDDADLCLEVPASDIGTAGALVQVGDCNGQPQQRWQVDDGRFVNAAGLCLEVEADDMASNGGRARLGPCDGQIEQRWLVP